MSFFDTVGAMFSNLAGGPDGAHTRAWNELKPWLATLGPSASRKWIPRISSGNLCEVPVMQRGHKRADCDNIGLASCVVCSRNCCLQHAHIDQHADAICYLCVADAAQVVPPLQRERARQERATGGAAPPHGQRQQPSPGGAPPPRQNGPSPEMVTQAFNALGLRRGAKWETVKAAHKKLCAQNHPDKFASKGTRARAAAEARFVEIRKAFDLLKTQYPADVT